MPVIRLENVSKEFGRGVVALDDLSLEIGDREILTVVGPSGCGKSTLLRLIAGLDSPTSGRIRMDDESIEAVPARDRNIAMVFQSYALYPHMTCYDNLALNLRLKKLPVSEIEARVRETATMLEITEQSSSLDLAADGLLPADSNRIGGGSADGRPRSIPNILHHRAAARSACPGHGNDPRIRILME